MFGLTVPPLEQIPRWFHLLPLESWKEEARPILVGSTSSLDELEVLIDA